LSWDTILRKRENYRTAFDDFDAEKIVRYDAKKVESLLQNDGIVRNRLKIASTIQNAKGYLKIREELGSFDSYVWRFVDGKPIVNNWKDLSELPAKTSVSDAISKDLRKRGFNFVGSTIMYAYMQACGLVNDHLVSCFRYKMNRNKL
jgi:DNA-3-methyladenine glycosylase I